MADLKITELAALAGVDLAAGDLLAVADVSASETKKITVTDFFGNASTLIADATIPGAKIVFGSGTIPGSAVATGGISATQLGSGAVTAAKLANESTVDLVTTLPASGAFVGQFALDTDDSKAYIWNGSSWVSFKAAGSINTAVASTAGIVNITVTTSGDQVTIGTSLDNTGAAAEFLAGPTGAAGAVSYRAIAGGDLPTATTSAKGGVQVNGNGLTMAGDTLTVDNTVTLNTAQFHVVKYTGKGLVTAGRQLISGDLPLASAGLAGAVYPGTGLTVSIDGELDHTNTVAAATATKVTFDTEGHITASDVLAEADIPNISATKLTSGTIDTARIGNSSITGAQIANYAVSKFGETQPTADHIGQFFFNPISRDLFLWDGNVFQPIGISVGEIVFAGTFDASAGGGTGLVASVTAEGTAVGLTAGQVLPAASTTNNRYYLVVSEAGTITSGNAPNVALSPPDIVLSNGNEWTEIDVSQTITAQVASNVSFTPAGDLSSSNVQAALQELDTEKLALAGGTMTGELLIGTAGSFAFEGSSANAFETFLAVVDPTADRTITFPDASGNIVLSGSIANADINASAAIAFSKLASLTSANILVGSSGNVATSVAVTGDVTISNAGVTAIAAGAIVNADVNASAAIVDTKLATIATAGKVSNSATTATNANTASAIVARDASGNFSAGTITAALTGAASSNVLKAGDTMTGALVVPLASAATPSLTFTGDLNTGIYSPGADQLAVATNGVQRLTVDTAATTSTLPVVHPLGAVGTPSITFTGDLNTGIWSPAADTVAASTAGSERLRIDSSGRLLIGTSSAFSGTPLGANLQIESSSQYGPQLNLRGLHDGSNSVFALFDRARGSNIVQSGDSILQLDCRGFDGANYQVAARILAQVDGTPGTNDMPGRLTFSTTADGASTPTERMRIGSAGRTDAFGTSETLRVRTAATTAAASIAIRLQAGATSITAGGTTEFQVTSDGNVANTNNSYGAISDIKLKENIVDANSQWDDLKALKVRNYNFKEGQTHTQIGLVAQEVELVSPGLVSEFPDRDEDGNDLGTVTKSVNYSVLYMKAVKALQEAIAKIESLEARLTAAGI